MVVRVVAPRRPSRVFAATRSRSAVAGPTYDGRASRTSRMTFVSKSALTDASRPDAPGSPPRPVEPRPGRPRGTARLATGPLRAALARRPALPAGRRNRPRAPRPTCPCAGRRLWLGGSGAVRAGESVWFAPGLLTYI